MAKLKKGQKYFGGRSKVQSCKKANFNNLFTFLRLIGGKNSFGALFLVFRGHKGQKGQKGQCKANARPNHRKLQKATPRLQI